MTADHLRPLLEHSPVAIALGHAALLLAQNRVPEEVMNALRCGRVGCEASWWDVFRRVVARTIAKQCTKSGSGHGTPSVRTQDESWVRDSRPHPPGSH